VKLGSHYAMSDENKAKISAGMKGYQPSLEARAKLSAALKGKPKPQSVIEALRKSHLGVPMSDECRAKLLGRITPAETRAKMSLAHMGQNVPPEVRMKISKGLSGIVRPSGAMSKCWMGGQQISGRKSKAKRRALGFVPLNEPFEGSEAHHIDTEHVIYVPKELHMSIRHNVWTGENMERINVIACQYMIKEVGGDTGTDCARP
jgi:hypothetical protein